MMLASNSISSKRSPLVELLKRKNSQFIHPTSATNPLINNTSSYQATDSRLPSNDVSLFKHNNNPYQQSSQHKSNGNNANYPLFSNSLKKQFGSTSPIPRASCVSNNTSASQLSYRKFVKQTAIQFQIAQQKNMQQNQNDNTTTTVRDTLKESLSPLDVKNCNTDLKSNTLNMNDSSTRYSGINNNTKNIHELLLLSNEKSQNTNPLNNTTSTSINLNIGQVSLNSHLRNQKSGTINNSRNKQIDKKSSNPYQLKNVQQSQNGSKGLNKHKKLQNSNTTTSLTQKQSKQIGHDNKENHNSNLNKQHLIIDKKQVENKEQNQPSTTSEWRGFTHHFIAKKLNKAIEQRNKKKLKQEKEQLQSLSSQQRQFENRETKETLMTSSNNFGSQNITINLFGSQPQQQNATTNSSNQAQIKKSGPNSSSIFTQKTSLATAITTLTKNTASSSKNGTKSNGQRNKGRNSYKQQTSKQQQYYKNMVQGVNGGGSQTSRHQYQNKGYQGVLGMLSDDMTSHLDDHYNYNDCEDGDQPSLFYNQSMIMDENSPHKNMKDLACTISNNSFILGGNNTYGYGGFGITDRTMNCIKNRNIDLLQSEYTSNDKKADSGLAAQSQMKKAHSEDRLPQFFKSLTYRLESENEEKKYPLRLKLNDLQNPQNLTANEIKAQVNQLVKSSTLATNKPTHHQLNQNAQKPQQKMNNQKQRQSVDCFNCEMEQQKLVVTEEALNQAVMLALDLYDQYEMLQVMKQQLESQ
eukprot:403350252